MRVYRTILDTMDIKWLIWYYRLERMPDDRCENRFRIEEEKEIDPGGHRKRILTARWKNGLQKGIWKDTKL